MDTQPVARRLNALEKMVGGAALVAAIALSAGFADAADRTGVHRESRSAARSTVVQDMQGPVKISLRSAVALVQDAETGEVVLGKNADSVLPIASITKLMTAMVVVDTALDLDEEIELTRDDVDRVKGSRSRLLPGTVLTRDDLLLLALMASENRAAAALGRAFPGGTEAFVAAMNGKARELGMQDTLFAEPTGLSSRNVSTARDLALLVNAAHEYPLIREYSTRERADVRLSRRTLHFRNTNGLVRNPDWNIELSKTGYISEAGRCLVMRVRVASRDLVVVLLDSWGKYSRVGDAKRIRKWVEGALERPGRASM